MIPIFIITRDRVSVLQQCLPGYLALEDVEIIIHDNGSSYPPMLTYLKELEARGIKVRRYPAKVQDMAVISELVQNTIEEYYMDHDSEYYIVTDPDIELENPSPKLLEVYKNILTEYPGCICVGPMLRIDDIPDYFKFKNDMVHSHMLQFWDDSHNRRKFEDTLIQRALIDTTFAMYRKSFRFKRLNLGIRVHEPYMARHLDWYMDTDNLTTEQLYYKNHASNVSTMSMHLRNGGMG
jgi:hypothetical protein